MRKNLLNLFCIVYLFVSMGCASWNAAVVRNNNFPLVKIQRVVSGVLPRGVRSVSPNGREFYSNYFIPSKQKFLAGDKSPVRYTAFVTILGDRRPYTVEILVQREKLEKQRGPTGEHIYSKDGSDERMGKKLARRLVRKLKKESGEGNVVDDFRVF